MPYQGDCGVAGVKPSVFEHPIDAREDQTGDFVVHPDHWRDKQFVLIMLRIFCQTFGDHFLQVIANAGHRGHDDDVFDSLWKQANEIVHLRQTV